MSSSSKRRLQWTLGILAAAPAVSALQEIIRGAQGVPGGSPDVIPTVDNSLRYANPINEQTQLPFAVVPVIWSHLAHVERSPAVSFAATTIAVGGLARLVSWQQRGRPHPVTIAAVVLELGQLPILFAWRRRINGSTDGN